jgi:hypothetical protein
MFFAVIMGPSYATVGCSQADERPRPGVAGVPLLEPYSVSLFGVFFKPCLSSRGAQSAPWRSSWIASSRRDAAPVNENLVCRHEPGSAGRGDPAGWPRRGAPRHDIQGFIGLYYAGIACSRSLAMTGFENTL